MMEFPLDKNINAYITFFNEIYEKIIKNNDPELLKKFSVKHILNTIIPGLSRRNETIKFANSIKDSRKGKDNEILIWDDKYIYEEIRFIALSSLLAACCGVYDNINYVCRNLLKNNSNISDRKTMTDSILEFSDLNNHKSELDKIKSKYGFALALFYSIRHNIFHRLHLIGGRVNKFETKNISDGYDCPRSALIELKNKCFKVYKVGPELCCNDKLLNAFNSDGKCFLALLEILINDIDLCIGEFINYSVSLYK